MSEELKPEWISVEDRLPDFTSENLCATQEEYIYVDWYLVGSQHYWENDLYTPTHWMPLPAPPKQDKDNG